MLYRFIYPLFKALAWLVIRLLPVEAFNRLCTILPGRCVIYGLRHYGATIGRNVTITPPIVFHNFSDRSPTPFANLTIGDACYLGRNILLDLKDKILIENNVTLAMDVIIITHVDVALSPLKDGILPSEQSPVVIHGGAYLGVRSTILRGVEIGECAVVAAGAVVIKSVEPYRVYGGVPARELRRLSREL